MDPTTTLQEALQAAQAVLTAIDGDDEVDPDSVERLADRLVSLDGWMRAGGFMPRQWKRAADGIAASARRPYADAIKRIEEAARTHDGAGLLAELRREQARGVPER